MMGRIRDALRRRVAGPAPERQDRPNALRRGVVRAERLRREAMQADAAARVAQPTSEEQRTPRERAPALPDAQAAIPNPLTRMLTSRSGLRQAWVGKEILGPPVALRDPYENG
jgi:hypothetical protein